jgi:ATP/maltotriose-dependent transcriptional regulator MalT
VLAPSPSSKEFAQACGYLAEWRLESADIGGAIALSEQAMAVANRLGDDATTAHARISVGLARLVSGDAAGSDVLKDGLDLARRIGHEEFVLRALKHLAAPPGLRGHTADTRAYIVEGLAFAREHDLPTKIVMFGSMRLALLLDSGEWESAIAAAEELLANPATTGRFLLDVSLNLGLARLRSGQAAPAEFDRATEVASQLEGERTGAVDAALAEAAWLKGDCDQARAIASPALGRAQATGDIWAASALALWLHRCGQRDCDHTWALEPYALEIQDAWKLAAAMWQSLGMPLEAARARAASTEEAELRATLVELDRLGARPDAARVVRRLRQLGFRHIPRGPRPATRATYGSLTRREVEVLGLLSAGSSNREIAAQLYLSPKTIDHHISAILGKLEVTDRQQAVNRAREVGLLPK